MQMLRAAFHTLGCKTNHYETDAIAGQFEKAGFKRVAFNETADVYIINTCTVTGEADRKSRQMLRRAKKTNPAALVVALGCHVELSDTGSYADLAIGTQGKGKTLAKVLERMRSGQQSPFVPSASDDRSDRPKPSAARLAGDIFYEDRPAGNMPCDGALAGDLPYEELGLVDHQSETRAYLKVEDGCNSFCTYCIIPFVRGRVRSRAPEQILKEATALAASGYREIVLTGIHVCSYGADRGEPSHAIAELVGRLAGIQGIERIRLGSLEPLSVTETFIRLLSDVGPFCPHFHLSLQSGSNTVLRRMNRKYRTAQFRSVVAMIRSVWPLAGITTDIIVGFPGETEQEFQDTEQFCREMAFSNMHVFRYSPRAGTQAAILPGQIRPEESAQRSRILQALADQMADQYAHSLIGSSQTILVEKQLEGGFVEGYTPSYFQARILPPPQSNSNPGDLLTVEIRSAGRAGVGNI